MDVMELLSFLLFGAGAILMVLRMFGAGLLWGLGALLVSALAVPLFVLFRWERARGPLGLWLLAILCLLLRVLKDATRGVA